VNGDQLDAYLDTVLIGGREPGEIVIADYDPDWPRRFELERARIAAALGELARRIEHIGSTAVPGLAAKPIIDVLVTVADPDDESAFAPELERAGYALRVREPDHRMFRTPERDVHVHIWSERSTGLARHLAFRDRLRASPEDRAEYELLKRSLAPRKWSDMNRYAEAKGPLIEAILARAGYLEDGVRPAHGGDAAAIAGLLGELGYATEAGEARARIERLSGSDDAGVLVYVLDREVVGLVAYHVFDLIYRPRPHCRITALVVRAGRRRQGLARTLLAALESLARERGCARIELTTRPDRPDALGFYEACGFSERPRRLAKVLDGQ
jgi:GrpB-like predicted nucleotidyltransferase (UPF0157 family)/predicted N-acetyltransferase YhbS